MWCDRGRCILCGTDILEDIVLYGIREGFVKEGFVREGFVKEGIVSVSAMVCVLSD